MHVYGQLISAQYENLATDPTNLPVGRTWYNSVSKRVKFSDGTLKINLLANDGYCVFGTHATASNNIRLHRGDSGVLQFVPGDNATSEGTLATSLNQLSFRNENHTTGTIPAYGNAGRVIWDSSAGVLKVDSGTSWLTLSSTAPTNHKLFTLGGTITAGTPVRIGFDGKIYALAPVTPYFDNSLSGVEFEAGSTLHVASCYDTTNDKVVVAYQDHGDSDKGKAVVGTIVNGEITFGTPVEFAAGSTSSISICFQEYMGQVVIAFANDASSGKGQVIVGTVSGTTIAFGTAVDFEAGDVSPASGNGTSICATPNGPYVQVAFADGGDSSHGKICTCTITDYASKTITASAPTVFSSEAVSNITCLYNHYHHKVMILFLTATTYYLTHRYSTASPGGMTISTTERPAMAIDQDTGDVFVAHRHSTTSQVIITRYIPVITGSDLTDFWVGSSGGGLCFKDYTYEVSSLAMVFDKFNKQCVLGLQVASGAGANFNSIKYSEGVLTYNTSVPYDGSSPIPIQCNNLVYVSKINSVLAIYRDDNDSKGKCIVTRSHSNYECVGILQESGNLDDSKYVCMLSGVSTVHSGQKAGSKAYLQTTGAIGTTKTEWPIGMYVASTDLLVTKNP